MPGYMSDIRATTEFQPSGRIVVLEDVDDDGMMDRRTVFLDGLVLPRSLKVLSHGVLVGAPPDLWLVRDVDGDLRADTREVISTSYGDRASGPEHNPNGLLWGLDNRIHTSQWNRILRPRNGTIVAEPTLARGQWGLSMDDAGRIYRNRNQEALFVDLVPAPYYARHSVGPRTRGLFEPLHNSAVNTVWPMQPTPGVNRGYQTGILRADGRLAAFTSACAPTVYRGDRLPAELYGNVFVAEPAGNLVSRLIVGTAGGTMHARQAYPDAEFLGSTDERFRPVYLSSAPDGTLHVVDMYRGIIQHRTFITEYLRDHIVAHGLEQPTGFGRIYRIVHRTTRRDARPALSGESSARLVDRLAHPNGWWRDTAQRLLVERGDSSVVPLLADRIRRARFTRTRLHALWTLEGLDSADPAVVEHALVDRAPEVRAAAIRVAERWLAQPAHPLQDAVIARIGDTDVFVRRQLAATLGMLPPARRLAALATLLTEQGNDPITVDAALSGVTGTERAALAGLPVLTASRAGPRAADPRRARERVAPQPCPTCPGARGGPGGARAFPSAAGSARVSPAGPSGAARSAAPSLAATNDEQAFAVGYAMYAARCLDCHQADGRGRDGLAPPLAGSAVVGGPAGALAAFIFASSQHARFAPLSSAELANADVAALVTYLRREFSGDAP
jgi:cytochrome c2